MNEQQKAIDVAVNACYNAQVRIGNPSADDDYFAYLSLREEDPQADPTPFYYRYLSLVGRNDHSN